MTVRRTVTLELNVPGGGFAHLERWIQERGCTMEHQFARWIVEGYQRERFYERMRADARVAANKALRERLNAEALAALGSGAREGASE